MPKLGRTRHFHIQLLALVAFVGTSAIAAQNAPDATASIHARLLTPLASYSPEGTRFAARVMGTFDTRVATPLPPGAIVRGIVTQAATVGIGFKRERASLELTVTACELPNGRPIECAAELTAIDNAREAVSRSGRVQGILAAGHPHSWLGGIWFHPADAISGRSASGLTGAGGKLQSVIAPSPIGAAITVISRMLVFRLPNPEIELPEGTDLVFQLEASRGTYQVAVPRPELKLSPELHETLQHATAEVMEPNGALAADIVNIALLGTRAQVAKAFHAAGWSTADPLTPRTFAKTYAAAAGMRSYATAPVSPLHLNGRLPDAVFQKSLNSMAKRHHIRLWRHQTPFGTLWLGAATHDVAVAFEWKGTILTHRIDPYIDAERERIVYDLSESGCLESQTAIDRPHLAFGSPAPAVTDGALVVGRLRDCAPAPRPVRALKRPKRALTAVIARRFVLEGRHYMTRGNAYYWAYRGVRWTFSPSKATEARVNRPRSADDLVKVSLNPEGPGTRDPAPARPSS